MEYIFLIWILFILLALIPVIQRKMLDSARKRVLHRLEKRRGTRLIALIHRQESMSFFGLHVTRFIDIQDSEEVLRAIKLTDSKVPIDLVLHTPGGLVLAAEQIANALAKHAAPVTVFVPHYAMSGGTLIALAANQVVMDENAVLGPVDPQIGEYPAVSILNVVEQKKVDEVEDQTLILADIARKAVRQVKDTVKRIARRNYTPEQADHLARELVSGKWTHDYPISVDEAKSLGLQVVTDMPKEVYELMNLYPQTSQRRPSVGYIPMPYPYRPPAVPERGSGKKS
ncbi:MAG TPA: ATP-dependent Clp protease proteolytic subunit [Anaerolineaceae bacterium]